MSTGGMTRVLVADDSPTMRQALRTLLDADPGLRVVAEAADGEEAVALANRLRPDVITMDVLMPLLDGLRATERIMETAPTRILVVSQLASIQQDLAIKALAAGALELVPKPQVTAARDLEAWGREIREAIRLMREIPVVTRHRGSSSTPPAPPQHRRRALAAVGIVASTGGPQVVASILAQLPADLPVPVLVAQHIAAGFLPGLARWFAESSRLRVRVASHGERPLPGCVYLAPDGCDLIWAEQNVLATPPRRSGHCPSGDALLESLARALGKRAAGVVLSGMGEDGARGLLAVRQAGGLTLSQSAETCVVYGMPRAAELLGAVERVADPARVAPILVEACHPLAPEANDAS